MAQADPTGFAPTNLDPSVPPRLAELLVQLMHKSGEPDFGYDEESIAQISIWINHARGTPDEPETRQMAQLAAAFVGEDWRETTTVYGPAFTLLSEPLALAALMARRPR